MDKWLSKSEKRKSSEEEIALSPSTSRSSDSTTLASHVLPGTSKKSRKRYFLPKWLEDDKLKGWLIKKTALNKEDAPYCTFCDCFLNPHFADLKKHLNSQKHQSSANQIKSQPDISNSFKISTLTEKVRIAELKFAVLICQTNTPIVFMDSLITTLKSAVADSETVQHMSLKRTKVTAIIRNVLGNFYDAELRNSLKRPGCFYSTVIDGTTDKGSMKQVAMAVVFMDEDFVLRTRFLDMVELPNETADHLTQALMSTLKSRDIPIENMVGFASDSTAVMAGNTHSVFTNLKKEIPNIACIQCSCHLIHLCSSYACRKLPRYLEDTLKSIASHFSRSHKRQNKLKEFQDFFSIENHKMLSPCSTRWLSLKACVDRVLEQHLALKQYFLLEKHEEPSRITDSICDSFNNLFFSVYLEFMSYILEILNDFNKLFQSETPLLHELLPEVKSLLQTICFNFLKPEYLRGKDILKIELIETQYLPLESIYIGITAQESLNNLKNNNNIPKLTFIEVLETIQSFYTELFKQIKKRFQFDDTLFQFIEVVAPNFKLPSLLSITERFPILNKFINRQELDKEWRFLCLSDTFDAQKGKTLEFWKNIFKTKITDGSEKYSNLKLVLSLLLCLPFSNACVERIFSDLNNVKTCHRTNLNRETIVSLFRTRDYLKNQKFEPNAAMVKADVWNSNFG